MRKIFLPLLFIGCSAYAHNVTYSPGNPMVLTFGGGPGEIYITPLTGESCVVNASVTVIGSAGAPSPLISVTATAIVPAVSITFAVIVLRAPLQTPYEIATISGSWNATGAPNPNECTGSGSIFVQVQVSAPSTPTGSGNAVNAGGAADPVSAATGELYGYDESDDLSLNGPLPLTLRRYYGSYLAANKVTSALGTNWMHNFDVSLAISGTSATATLFRGKTVRFTQSGSAWTLSSTEQRPFQLIAAGGGYQFLDPRDNLIYSFNSGGALTAIQDRNGNTLTVTQDANGPTQIGDGVGRALTLTYLGSNLSKVQDQAGRSVSFEYSGGTLSAWSNAAGNRATFTYTSSGGLNALMTSSTRPAGNQPYTQQYDSQGRVASQSNSSSTTANVAYNSSTNGAALTEPMGITVAFAHDGQLNLGAATDASGGSIKYTYDSSNRVTSITDRLGNKTTITWDAASGLPATATDALGNTTTYTYAASKVGGFTFYDLASVKYADGSSVSYARDAKGNVTAFTDQAGKVWQATYNGFGRVATATNPSGGVTTYSYGGDGMLTSQQLPSGDTTKFGYDSAKRPNVITQPDGATFSLQYDALDNITKTTDQRSNSTAAAFDTNNNLKSMTDAAGAVTTTTYDGDDRIVSITDPLGKIDKRNYDAAGRLQTITDPTGVTTTYSYDASNHVTGETDTAGKTTTYGKDAEDRLTSLTDPLGRTTTLTPDVLGRTTTVATANGEKSTTAYDALGRITSATDALSRSAQFSFDPRGLLTQSALPGGVRGSFALNELGLVTGMTDPNGNVWSSAFDNQGRLTTQTDPLGQAAGYQYNSRQHISTATLPQGSVQYSYDAVGNLTGQTYSDGTAIAFSYDADNRPTGGTGVSMGYDAAGRVTSSNGLQIGYDDAGRMAAVTYASGKPVKYTYDNRGLLNQVQDWVGGATAFVWDAARQLTSIAFANGVTQTYTYDSDGRIKTIAVAKGGTNISSVQITRDPNGRITAAQRSAANVPGPADMYAPFAYDAASQSYAASHDPLGRVTGDAMRTYTWDLASRLSSYQGADGSGSFTYDAFGQRISSTAGGTTRNFVLNYALPLPSVAVVRAGTADQKYYIWLPSGILLESVDATSGARRFYHFDESGSANFLTDDTGAVTDSYSVTPYGESVAHTGTSDNPFTFQGALGVMQEAPTSLYYMRARYYDSGSARFVSRDPKPSSDPRAMSPYQFCYGDPVQGSDPTGADPPPPPVVTPEGCFVWRRLKDNSLTTDSLAKALERIYQMIQSGKLEDKNGVLKARYRREKVPCPDPPKTPPPPGQGVIPPSSAKTGEPIPTPTNFYGPSVAINPQSGSVPTGPSSTGCWVGPDGKKGTATEAFNDWGTSSKPQSGYHWEDPCKH
jgi:RHS repeat-associated protein